MSCNPENYKAVLSWIRLWFVGAVDWLDPWIGRPLAIVAILILMAPVALAFIQTCRVFIPSFMRLYYEESIEEKARHYWRRKCVGTGMTQRGAKISIAIGVVFYFLLRIIVAMPMYYTVTVPAFALAFVVVTAVGFACRGNIPQKPSAWWRYCRKFQAPTMTGMGLGIATIFLDFVIHSSLAAVTYLHSI